MLYLIDSDQLAVLTRVKKRLYDEMRRLGADERRDLANAMDAVLHNVEQYGAIPEEAIVEPCCGHPESAHETREYRGDKARHCLAPDCPCRRFREVNV